MEFNATFLVSTISFIVFSIIMNWIFYKPIQKIVMERQKFIGENYDEARTSKDKTEAILNDKQEKLQRTKNDAKKMLNEKTTEAKLVQDEIKDKAQQGALELINEGKSQIKVAQNQTDEVLQDEIENLSQSISDKIMGAD